MNTPAFVARQWLLPQALLGGLLGVFLQLQQAVLWPWPMVVAALVLSLGLGWAAVLRSAWRMRGGLVLLAAALFMWSICGLRAAVFLAAALEPQLEGRDITVVGVIAAMPQRSDNAVRLRLAVESATLGGKPVRLPERIDLAWYVRGFHQRGVVATYVPAVRAGQRWRLSVRLKSPHGARNPYGFDYELWLWEQGVQANGYVRTDTTGARAGKQPQPELLANTWQYPVEQARQHVRDAIVRQLAGTGDVQRQRAAGVIAALVTGDQRAIVRADWDVFRITGVAHLMSISGLHITMFAWLAIAVTGRLWRCSAGLCQAIAAPTAALIGGVLLAAAYALFSGWGVPAQRTICMLTTVALLRLFGCRWPWPQVWLLACAVVLAVDPWALLQAGFWLSFVAVAVLFASDPGVQGSRETGSIGLGVRALAMLRTQWVITLAITPLTLLLFGQISIVGFAANAFAIPWSTLLVIPLAMAGVFLPPLWQVAQWCVQVLLELLHTMAAWPWAQATLPVAAPWAGVAAVFAGVLLALHLPWRVRLLGLPLLLPALCWQAPRPAAGQFDLLAADVGQGMAVLVRTSNHSLLYDTGPSYGQDSDVDNDAGARILVPLLQALGEQPDMLMLSHGDSDHAGGAASVLARHPQVQVVGSIEARHPLRRVRHAIAPCVAGQHWQWDGVRFEVLHPPAGKLAPTTNAQSCVLRVTANAPASGSGVGASALLAGDIERAQERALVANGASLAADVLLMPHHGSKTSSSAEFLDAVRPHVAIAQAGYRNRFGHPAAQVLQRYAQRGITVVQTPSCGAASWSSSAPLTLRCEREAKRRYWHHKMTMP